MSGPPLSIFPISMINTLIYDLPPRPPRNTGSLSYNTASLIDLLLGMGGLGELGRHKDQYSNLKLQIT